MIVASDMVSEAATDIPSSMADGVGVVAEGQSGCLVLADVIKTFREDRFWENIRLMRDKGLVSDSEWISGDILPQYRELYEQNPDMAGWLTIGRARIDSPVMQTKGDPEYYLRRDFGGREDSGETPFIDYRCSVFPRSSFNLILYGHYTDSDRLFRRLLDYAYKYEGSKSDEICFDTLTEKEFKK